jgi:DNA-binding SARP family transcriptional activator
VQPVRVEVLGRFRVLVGTREVVDWPGRRAVELVQLLALAEGRSLLREQVIDALWPHLDEQAGAANLRKAAHHARRAFALPDAVVLRGGRVALLPGYDVEVDAACFEAAAAAARGDAARCAHAAELYRGDLLPEAVYATWSLAPRDRLRSLHLGLLRAGGQWEQVAALDPTDETAHQALMAEALAAGNRHAALRWYGRLCTSLERDLGVRPSPQTQALYEECVADLAGGTRTVVGRHVERARLHAALRAGDDQGLRVVALRGPGGIGKSTLCRDLLGVARQEGWAVVAVRAAAESGPYAPLVQAVEVVLRDDRALLGELPDRTRSVLAELSPLAAAGAPLDGPVTRHHVIGAVRRLLVTAASARGMLLVVDDAHLADDDGVTALLHLSGPLRVVLAYRQEEASAALAQGVERLRRAGAAERVDVAPLEHDEAAALVHATVGNLAAEQVDQVLHLGQGNPFLLRELAKGAGSGELPRSVTEAVAGGLAHLDEGSRVALQRLAVAADELDVAGVLAVTGLDETAAFSLLDAALAADLLVVTGSGYRFRHELLRQALAAQVAPHRRVELHREAARRLASSGGRAEAVAGHWLAAESPAEAVPWLAAAAAEAVRLGAFADALNVLDTLLAHAPEHTAGLALRAQALEAVGDERAPAAYAAAARVADGDARHDLRAKQALASVRAGDPAAALEALEGVAPRTLEGRLAHALALGGAAAMGFADPELGVAMAAETRRLAIASGQPSAVVIASWAEAAAAHAKGDLPRSLRAGLRETYALPELAITVFDGHLCVAERLLYGNRPYDEVIAFADALETEADRLGAGRGKAFATTFRGEARLLTGQLDTAEADLEAGLRLHRALGAAGGEALSLQRLAEIALARGDRARAGVLLDDALEVARGSNLGFHLFDRIYGTRVQAAADARAGLAAVEEAEQAVHGSMETCPGCRIALAVPSAIAAATAGDLERATRYEQAVEQLTTLLMRLPGWYAALDEVRAHRVAAEGDPEQARQHLLAAAARYDQAGHRLDAVRCRELLDVLGR